MRRAGRASAESPISSGQLDQLPAEEERAAGRAGVTWATPRREGLQAVAWEGCAGALRFVFQGAIVPFPSGALCRSSREAPSGLRDAPAGPRVVGGAGERAGASPRSMRRGSFHAPFFVESLVESCLAAATPLFSAIPSAPRALIRALRLRSDRGHPRGQESGERIECRELNRLESPQRRRFPAVPEIGDDSWPSGCQLFRRRSAVSSSWPGPRPYLRRVGDVRLRRTSDEEGRRPLPRSRPLPQALLVPEVLC